MNTASKYMQLYLRQMHFISPNILKHQYIIQQHEFSIKYPLLHFSPCLTTIRNYSNTNQTGFPNLTNTNDILLISIKTAKETKDVLEMLRLHNSVMTIQQHLQSLNSLFILQKNKRTNLVKEELVRSPEFTALCHKIQNYSRNLELNEVINCLKCLSYLGISVNTNIMQTILQLISKMINNMSLQQITFLHFLLKDLSQCPLVDALNIALPIVFETQVRRQVEDKVTIYWQVEFLNYVTKHKLSQETFDFIMSKIIKNINQLNPKMIHSLLCSLYHKDYSTLKYIDTINKCLQMYTSHLDYVTDFSYIEVILIRMIVKYFTESDVFYNERFINAIVEYIIKTQNKFENIGYLMKKLNKIGYVSRDLIDYATNLLTSNHAILETCKIGVLLSYIGACANANYIPPGFIELRPFILKGLNIQKDILKLPWLLVTFDLAVLGCWSEELLTKVFSEYFLCGFLKRKDNMHDYIMLLKLYQATMTLYPGDYKGSLPPMEIIDKAIDIQSQYIDNFPLKAALEHGLGGDDYVLTGVRSQLGHFIDHIVVMRPGGFSIAIKNQVNCDNSELFLENIIENFLSSDTLVIGIMANKPNCYVINLNTLKGSSALTNKTIETLGVVLLSINMDVWNELLDYEKIPYIMRELKSIVDLNLIKKTNVFH